MEITKPRGTSWAFVITAPLVAAAVIATSLLLTTTPAVSPVTAPPTVVTEPAVKKQGSFGSLTPKTFSTVDESGSFGSLSSNVAPAAAVAPKAPVAKAPATKTPAPAVTASPAPQARASVVPSKAVKQTAVAPTPVAAPVAPVPVVKVPVATPTPVAPTVVAPKPVATPTPVAKPAAPVAAPARASKFVECGWNYEIIAEVENPYWCELLFWDKFGKEPTWTVLTPRPASPSLGSAVSVERLADGRFSCSWNGRQVAIASQSSYCGLFFNDLDGLDATWH